jgi:cobalamin biosynthesis Mg chelatase CobN
MLCVSSVPGVALAAQPRSQPTNPAQNQYTEVVPKVNGGNHTSGAAKHKSTGTTTKPTESTTTSTGAGETPITPAAQDTTATVVGTTQHTTKHHKTKKPSKTKPKPKSGAGRRGHVLSSKPTHGAAGLTAAAATGSGGGMGVWLLVILILVLVTGSAVGILRYRRNR